MKLYTVHYIYDVIYHELDSMIAGTFSTLEAAIACVERGKKDPQVLEVQGRTDFYVIETVMDIDYRFNNVTNFSRFAYEDYVEVE